MDMTHGSPAEPHGSPEPQGSPAEPHGSRARGFDRSLGLAIIAAAFLLSLGISLWAKRVSEPEQGSPPAPPTRAGVEGFPKAVDPVKLVPRVEELTPRATFRGFAAENVKADGTVDVSSDETGKIVYSFESPRGHGPQLPRKTGEVPRRDLCGRQKVHVDYRGLYAANDQPGVPCSGAPVETLPVPHCSLARVWQLAKKRGANEGSRARIEYYRAHAGPAYRFELNDGSLRFSVYGDCGRMLSTPEAAGYVP